jgi:uncharacterized protein YPO0396
MTQQPLLYLEGATEGTTQWRAETLQMVNWGGFQGPTRVSFALTSTLLSGASGTGKSTLLDAYLALMMPSDTPFNGASNDATTGRARSADQRNLITYLRGKTDSTRTGDTSELTDQVLRGRDSSTWGAVGMTFIDDNKRRFTVARVYFVPRGATRFADITMKMITIDGFLDLTEMDPLAAAKFEKRALKTRFPTINVHDTYGQFSQTLYTRLGIGKNGDGKALRLLARIQAGQQVRTVDDLYKSMVIEAPSTYAAADNAVEHFIDLEASYEAMLTEADKQKVLARLPDLWTELQAAQTAADLIDTFGIHREGDSPFTLWSLKTEDALLEVAEDTNRAERETTKAVFEAARREEAALDVRLRDVQDAQREAGGSTLKRLEGDITRLGFERDTAERARRSFDINTAALDLNIDTEADFNTARHSADEFIAGFDDALKTLTDEQQGLMGEQWPLADEKRQLRAEVESLQGRAGRVPKDLHDTRLLIAQAANLDPSELAFVAELIDVLPEHARWRKAAEVVLHGLARVLVIEDRHLDRVSRAIDPLRLPVRINFEGVAHAAYEPVAFDPAWLSGKLAFKDSPFAHWVQDRVSANGTDALCVEDAQRLGDGGRRVTVNGQTRQGRSGAHGEFRSSNIIGFSNEDRLAEIAERLEDIETALTALDGRTQSLTRRINSLHATKGAHEHVLAAAWVQLDYATIEAAVADLKAQHQRILDSNDRLRALQQEEEVLSKEVKEATGRKMLAEQHLTLLDADRERLVDRKDAASRAIDRIDDDQSVVLTDDQTLHLNDQFAKVADPDDLARFDVGIDRLKRALSDQSKASREKSKRATDSLTNIFETYQSRWPDPNLSTDINDYGSYRDILDRIASTGLHERRQEWSRRLTDWSGQDLVPLAGAFETSISDIEDRLRPVNDILERLPFGDRREQLKIDLRRVHRDDITKFRRELSTLSRAATADFDDDQIEAWFKRLRRFMNLIRKDEAGGKGGNNRDRDYYLDVRKHIVITAVALDANGVERSTYAALGGKSGGETQELIAFIVGAALRFQLGDEANTRPRFAPVFLDEGFVKSDSEFAGRAVTAWKGLGFQLIIGAPLDKVTALEPHVDKVLAMSKNAKGYSYLTELTPTATTASGAQVHSVEATA